MGTNKKVTKLVRERMARTGENYTEARTRLQDENPRPQLLRVRSVADLEPGSGEAAAVWRTVRVRYTLTRGGQVLFESGERPKAYALDPDSVGWMREVVGLRVGGVRRIEGDFGRWGPCEVEVRLLAVEAYTPPPPSELKSGTGRLAARGDRVRVRYQLHLRDGSTPNGVAMVASSGEAGLWFTVGVGEVEADLERVVEGMQVGGSRTAVLAPLEPSGPARWLILDLVDLVGP